MTSVYGVTYIGARDQIKKSLKEHDPSGDEAEQFGPTCYASKVTLTALGEMFKAARSIKSKLGDCAKDGRDNAFYSTPSIYTDAKFAPNESWPLKTDDYFLGKCIWSRAAAAIRKPIRSLKYADPPAVHAQLASGQICNTSAITTSFVDIVAIARVTTTYGSDSTTKTNATTTAIGKQIKLNAKRIASTSEF